MGIHFHDWRRYLSSQPPKQQRLNRKFQVEPLENRLLLDASSDGFWETLDNLPTHNGNFQNIIKPDAFEAYTLDTNAIKTALADAPLEFTGGSTIITLPTPDEGFARFAVVDSPIMAPELAAQFPEIRTFAGQGIDDPSASVRFDLTPQGFHAQVVSPDGSYYVDPYWHLDDSAYISYYREDYTNRPDVDLSDDIHEEINEQDDNVLGDLLISGRGSESAERTGTQIRTYRLAVAATGEYTRFHSANANAPTVAEGQAAIVTAINRVTGIYESELTIRLQLVGNNSQLVYTDPATDPYTNNNGFALLFENQANVDTVIGNGNYDVGHVFTTGGGGLAGLGVVGINSRKAQGETGLTRPIGDQFYVDFVSHELGHQFGANHTWNGDTGSCSPGNNNPPTSMEPGSGTTIMGYAGICGNDNVAQFSDPNFHSVSLEEILAHVDGTIPGVGIRTNSQNSIPNVNAGMDYIIPARTPFVLTATGSDQNGDPLTYDWEERDLGPQRDLAAPDNGLSPLFRFFPPTADPSRIFPQISDILTNSTTLGEQLPTTNRDLNFRAVVRDGRGGVNSDDALLTVIDTGAPFRVTSPQVGDVWLSQSQQVITWDVAGTDANGIDEANVMISLSLDGGLTFPQVITASTPNDGTHTITVPDVSTANARIMISAVNSIFFDISDGDYIISQNEDWGDAPNSYRTLIIDDGPRHRVDATGPVLGGSVDIEFDGLPSPLADGDDATGIDDENGVVFTPMGIAQNSSVNVTVTQANGRVDGWIDFNQDGFFGANEKIANSVLVTAGTTQAINFIVPGTAIGGNTYARFRVSTAGGLDSTGRGLDGEVEDYLVTVGSAVDYGDAPDTGPGTGPGNYQTLVNNLQPGAQGPSHTIAGPRLGIRVDGENDGQPTLLANGDDAAGFDDDDGVFFTALQANSSASVSFKVTGMPLPVDPNLPVPAPAFVSGWLDFNQDGVFALSERIVNRQVTAAQNNAQIQVAFNVPATAQGGITYARFRVSTSAGLSPLGAAPDGEVEDYQVVIQSLDFGDAPDGTSGNGTNDYSTRLASNGPRHVIGGPRLGSLVDREADALINGLTDDVNGVDDEDGVVFGAQVVSQVATTTVSVSNSSGQVDAWIDFNRDGIFSGAEQIVTSGFIPAGGSRTFSYFVPAFTVAGTTFARFRVSSRGGLGPNGEAADGEVEDHVVVIAAGAQFDYGDAPDGPYPTLAANDGARHAISSSGPILGTKIDGEKNGQPNATATGDDVDGNNDDDGIVFVNSLIPGQQGIVQVTISQADGLLNGWIDFDGDGMFESNEQLFTDRAVASSTPVLIAANRDGQQNELVAINSVTGAVVQTLTAPQTVSVLNGLAFDGDHIWYIEGLGGAGTEDILYKMDASGAVVASFDLDVLLPGTNNARLYDGLAALNNRIYVQDSKFNQIHVFDVSSERITATLSPGAPLSGGLAAISGPDRLLAADQNTNQLFEIDPRNGRITATISHNVTNISGLGVVDGLIFISSLGDNTVTVINRAGVVQRTMTVTPGADSRSVSIRSLAGGVNAAGPNTQLLSFQVPAGAATGATMARFRVDTGGGLDPTGLASNGEVEDYRVTIGEFDAIGINRSNQFFLDVNDDGAWNGTSGGDGFTIFGNPTGDTPIVGDWDGDGDDNIGIHRGNQFFLDATGDGKFNSGDVTRTFGNVGDTPIAGDWNGDGKDEIGVHRANMFFLDTNANGSFDAGDSAFRFGINGDIPIIGDWNGDGTDDIGIHRGNLFYLDFTGNGTFNAGDKTFRFGILGDTPITGDWNGDGKDDIGVHRGNLFYTDDSGDGAFGAGDKTFRFGNATDTPLIGNWPATTPLQAAAGPAVNTSTQRLTESQLAPIVTAAIDLLGNSGLTASQRDLLSGVRIGINDLQGSTLGLTSGSFVHLDADAAGYGWFVDETPLDNNEFSIDSAHGLIAAGDSAATGQMDLLTVVLHELSHVLGLEDDNSDPLSDDLLNGLLQVGTRRLPS